jgi:serine/threonine protein kinase
MKMIKHKNIVKLIEVLASNSKIYLVLELIKGGDLFDVIKGTLFVISNFLNREKWSGRENCKKVFRLNPTRRLLLPLKRHIS